MFLPFPQRYLGKSQLAKVDGVTREAAEDYVNFYSKLKNIPKMTLEPWHHGLVLLSKGG